MKNKTLSILLVVASFFMFGAYAWWGATIKDEPEGWGAGLWGAALWVFSAGVLTFFHFGGKDERK